MWDAKLSLFFFLFRFNFALAYNSALFSASLCERWSYDYLKYSKLHKQFAWNLFPLD